MKKSIVLSTLAVGLAVLLSMTVGILLFGSDLFEGKSNDLSDAPLKTPSYHPEQDLSQSKLGRTLIEIRRLSKTNIESAALQLSEFESQPKLELSPLENSYRLLTHRSIAHKKRDSSREKEFDLQLQTLATKHQFGWLKTLLTIDKSIATTRSGRLEEGESLIVKAIGLAKLYNVEYLLPRAYNVAGYINNASNQLIEAQHYFRLGIHAAERLNDIHYSSTIHNNLALLYLHIEKWNKALEFLEKARELELKADTVDRYTLQTILLNEAFVYNRLEMKEKSLQAYKESLKYFDAATASVRRSLIKFKGDAEMSLLLEKFVEASRSTLMCIDLPEAKNYPLEFGQCQLLRSKAMLGLGYAEEALAWVDQSIATFESIKHYRWQIRALKHKAQIYEELGEPQSALEIYRQYHQEYKQQLLTKVYDLERAFDTEKIQQEKELLDIEKQVAQLELGKERLRLQLACIWIVVVAIALVIVLRKAKMTHSKNQELEALSNVDQLTKLHNRRYYHQQLAMGNLLSADSEYRVVLLDLDYFKRVNDTHGHDVGDEVLVETAKRLKSIVLDNELLIRWGGEEFLLLLKQDKHITRRVNEALSLVNGKAYQTSAEQLAITVSIGVSRPAKAALINDDDCYFRNADQNLYEAKRSGRNQTIFPNED